MADGAGAGMEGPGILGLTRSRRFTNPARSQKWFSTWDFSGVEEGIRTRDSHLGKVFEFVHDVRASPLSRPPVFGISTPSAQFRPC
jgi:hypothetical protein